MFLQCQNTLRSLATKALSKTVQVLARQTSALAPACLTKVGCFTKVSNANMGCGDTETNLLKIFEALKGFQQRVRKLGW
jgi:hypothetical protein